MSRILMLCIAIVVTLAIIIAISAKWTQIETFKDLKVGMAAPDFTLNDENGVAHSLRDYLGKKNVALVFYPKDFTSG